MKLFSVCVYHASVCVCVCVCECVCVCVCVCVPVLFSSCYNIVSILYSSYFCYQSMCDEKVYGVLCFKYFHKNRHAYTLYIVSHRPSMYVYMHVYHIQSPFYSFQLPHSTPGLYSCKAGTTKSQTLIDGGGAAVGRVTGRSSQKFFAGHSGGLRADII